MGLFMTIKDGKNPENEKPKRVQRERRTIRGKQDKNRGPQGKKT